MHNVISPSLYLGDSPVVRESGFQYIVSTHDVIPQLAKKILQYVQISVFCVYA